MKRIFYYIFIIIFIIISLALLKYLTIGKSIKKYNIDEYFASNNNKHDSVQITFLGTSCFIFEYQNKKLITDPFFSNPEFLKGCFANTTYPSLAMYLDKSVYNNPDMIVISHGHYDHCLDIENFLSSDKQTTIVAEKHITNEIASVQKKFNVNFDTDMSEIFRYSADSTFRVLPIESTHSPHFAKVTLFKGEYNKPLEQFPDRLYKWKLHTCHSYLIDILDNNKIVCRALFVCGSLNNNSIATIKNLCANHPADLLLGIYWKDKICSKTLANAYHASKPEHVILHHWNNFFKATNKGVEVLRTASIEKSIKNQHELGIPSTIMQPMSSIIF